MTKHERIMIRSCISNGLEFCHDMRRGFIGKETIDLDRFNAIVGEVEVALDKQEPLVPTDISSNMYGFKTGLCRSCGSALRPAMNYCANCGQRINWEVDDNE